MLSELTKSDRSRAGLYVITCRLTNDLYIGMSKRLYYRFTQHLQLCVTGQGPLYERMRELLPENFTMSVVRYMDGCNYRDMQKAEAELIELLKPNLNTRRADPAGYRTPSNRRLRKV